MTAQRQAFVNKYSPLVNSITSGTGIFPETVFATAIIEAQNPATGEIPGTELSKSPYNNLFGIKDDESWSGKVVNLNTGEVIQGQKENIIDGFRVYDSPEDSFKDYISYLQSNPRYTSGGVFTSANYNDQATALQNSGYATNPDYAGLVQSVAKSISPYITKTTISIGFIIIVGILIYILSTNSSSNDMQ